ncbi:MAG: hypothetical protein CL624_11630 [Arcobacter sp.]|nr:hypothetical protein [Arcobacter sp.]|tara:strand:+ start:3191 stop:4636 length:1446 start_codon:yes stop_codon:yes gene_type:complete
MNYTKIKEFTEEKLLCYPTLNNLRDKITVELNEQPISNPLNVPNVPSFLYNINIKLSNINLNDTSSTINTIISDLSLLYKDIEVKRPNNIPPFVNIVFINSNIRFCDKIDIPWYIKFVDSNISVHIGNKNVHTVIITDSNFHDCIFEDLSFIANNTPITISIFKINLHNQRKINQFCIQYVNFKGTDHIVEISNTEIENLVLTALDTNLIFKFFNINYNKNKLKDNLYVQNCTFNNRFSLKQSKFIDNFDIKNVSFNNDVSFEGSTIKNIDLNEIYFKSLISIEFSGIKITNLELVNRNTFRKIKHFLEVDNNKIESNKFHSYEMEARQRELNKETLSTLNIMDKCIFFFNKQVSNHGLNWLLPLYWIFIIGLYFSSIFYSTTLNNDAIILTMICLVTSFISLFIMKFNDIGRYIISLIPSITLYIYICLIQEKSNYYIFFKFLNITDFDSNKLPSIFIGKVIMAYLIYHLLISFRKETRK